MDQNGDKVTKPSVKLTTWKNEPTYTDLYDDYSGAQDDHALFIADLERWAVNMDGGPEIKTSKGKSVVRPLVIRRQLEWTIPMIEEPFLNTRRMFNVYPRTHEDVESARQNQLLLNYQWENKIGKVALINDIARTIASEGTVIVKTGWESEEEEFETTEMRPVYAEAEESLMMLQQAVQSGQMAPEQAEAMYQTGEPMQIGEEEVAVTKTVFVKNNPTHEVCENENVTIDPTCMGVLSDAQFIVHEYDIDWSTLKENEYSKSVEVDEEGNEVVVESGIYKNLKSINVDQESDTVDEYDNDISPEDDTHFEFQDKARKKMRAYEYWGEWDIDGSGIVTQIVGTWIGTTMIRMEENPFPFEGLPFDLAKYMPRKSKIHGEPDGELTADNQLSIGKLKRAAHDITADKAVGQEFINEQFFSGPLQKDNYNNGRTVYFRNGMDPKTSIYRSSVDPVPNVVFNMIGMENAEAESMSGTKSFNDGISGASMGASVGGIKSAEDAISKRKLSILRRVADLVTSLGEKDLAMDQMYIEESEVVRITNEDFQTIKREDIQGNYDLSVEISTPEKDDNTAEKLNMLMQTNAASMNPEMSKMVYSKMADLWNMPELAEEFRTFEPEGPSPQEQELMQMRMDNAKLENKKLQMEIMMLAKDIESEDSKIIERKSRSVENLEADTLEKQAQAKENEATANLKNAQAEKLRSERDQIDQDFMYEYDGQKRKDHEMDKEFDARTSAEKEVIKNGPERREARVDRAELLAGSDVTNQGVV